MHVIEVKICSLIAEERCMFECAHKDVLLMETFLEGAPFETIKSFPFHFSNSRFACFFFSPALWMKFSFWLKVHFSQCIMNEVIETPNEKNLVEQQTNHMISERFSAPTQRLPGKNCQSTDYIPRQSRAPLRIRNISWVSRIN